MDYSPPGSSAMGFPRQEYWSELPFPPPGDLPNRGLEPTSPVTPALAGRFFTAERPGNWDFRSSVGKESACKVGDPGSIPGLGRSPREGNVNPLQSSCLENPMDSEAWWARVHGVARVGHDLTTKPPPPGNPLLLFSH